MYFFFFQHFKYVISVSSDFYGFWQEVSFGCIVPYVWVIFLLQLSRFCFYFFQQNLTMICLGMDFFVFFLLGIHWTSWICRSMFFIQYGLFSHCLFTNFFCYFLSFPFGSPIIRMMVSHRSLSFCSFSLVFFFLQSWPFLLIYLLVYCFFPLSSQISSRDYLVSFSFQLLYFPL